jgi:choline-sulfatase
MCFRTDERVLVNGLPKDRAEADRGRVARGQKFVGERLAVPGAPWAAYIGLTSPHPPFEAPQRYLDLYAENSIELPRVDPAEFDREALYFSILRNFSMISAPISEERQRNARRAYYAMITELDDLLGSFLAYLDEQKFLDDSLVVYTSDHGEMYGNHALWLKRSLYEESARVPLILAGAGLPRGVVIDTPVSDVDVTATLLDLAGAKRPKHLRGRSLLPLIHGDLKASPPHVYCESHTEGACTGAFMLRKGDWKYLHFSFYDDDQLFNLRQDPEERENLFGRIETAKIQEDLHGTLLSLVDPEEVSLRAFDQQKRFLTEMVGRVSEAEFSSLLRRRLGKAQADLLTRKLYPQATVDGFSRSGSS